MAMRVGTALKTVAGACSIARQKTLSASDGVMITLVFMTWQVGAAEREID